MYEKVSLPAQLNTGWQINLLFLFGRMFQNPLRVRTSLRLVFPSQLFSFLPHFPPSSNFPLAQVVSEPLSKALTLPCFPPQELQAESVSLNTNTSLQERKTMLGTGRDQVCIPQSTSCDGGAERRKGERTTHFRNPSSFTD